MVPTIAPERWGPAQSLEPGVRAFWRTRHGVTIKRFRHANYRLEAVPGCVDHLVAIRLSGRCAVERVIAGAHAGAQTTPGSITTLPAGADSSWSVRGAGELLYVFAPDALLQQLAAENDGHSPFTLGALLAADDPILRAQAESLVRELDAGLAPTALLSEALTVQFLSWVVRRHMAGAGDRAFARSFRPFSRAVVSRLLDYIEAHSDGEIDLDTAAGLAGCSRSHFSHRFKATFGTPPHRFVQRHRVERAKNMLLANDLPLAEVALAAGFAHQAHFITLFKRETGLTPGRFRILARGE